MDEEESDQSVIDNLLRKSGGGAALEQVQLKEAELSDEDELDKYMAGIEVSYYLRITAHQLRLV